MYNNNRYIPAWRLWLIHLAAKAAGLSVHVHGVPYGSRSRRFDLKNEVGSDVTGSAQQPIHSSR